MYEPKFRIRMTENLGERTMELSNYMGEEYIELNDEEVMMVLIAAKEIGIYLEDNSE